MVTHGDLQSHFKLGYPVRGDDFFGRKEHLNRVMSYIHTGSAVNFFSIRRMGKSSMLHHISHLCKADELWETYEPVFLDAMGSGGNFGANLLFRLGIDKRNVPDDDAWFFIEDHITRTSGKTLLLLDECDYWIKVQRVGKGSELAALRALHQSGRVSIVASTLYASLVDHLQDLEELSSPFYNILHTFRLPCFTPEEAEELIVTVASRGGVTFPLEYARELAHYVGYYPNLVQEIGHIAFLNKVEGRSTSVDKVAKEWLFRNGYQWVPMILSLFEKDYIGAVASLVGVSREEFLVNSFEAYGIFIRDMNGNLGVAPYIADFLGERGSMIDFEPALDKLANLAHSFHADKRETIEVVLEKSLRMAFRSSPPTSEREVQHYVDVILCAAGYKFVREGPIFRFSLRGYRPDYTVENKGLIIEVKLCREASDVSRVVEEMSADIAPYLKKQHSVLFVVFDLGGIHDPVTFREDFESNPNVKVAVIKR